MAHSILIVYAKSTEEIFNRHSALGSYIYCLATILDKNGYLVRINDIDFTKKLQQHTVPVTPIKQSFVKRLIPLFIKEYVKDKRMFHLMDELFLKIDNRKSFDSILEFYTYGSDIGYRLSEKYNKPLVLVYDNPVIEEHAFFHPGQLFLKKKAIENEKFTLLKASSIVVYSDAVVEYLNLRFNRKFPLFIHQNVDYTRFEFVEHKNISDAINIGFIGSFLKWHSVDLLLNAFTRLKDEGKNVKLFLIGNGMDYSRIKELVALNPYSSFIEMPGFMDGNQLLKYKEVLHIGVMPGSNWYGAPNKIFEYGAANMAVVAPDTPTIKSLFVDKIDLLLFKQNSEKDLIDKIRVYVDNLVLLKEHSQQLQKKIKQKYSEKITFEFYDQLLK